FAGTGNGDPGILRERNTWWDVVHATSGTPDIETVRRIRAIDRWSMDLDMPPADDPAIEAGEERPPLVAGGSFCDVYLIGWPVRCLWGIDARLDRQQIGLEPVPEWLEEVRFVHNPFPTRAWWPGMAANLALFGGAWLLVLTGPGVIRSWQRRRKGGCPACGYNVSGVAVCPECGTPVRRARASR
ncbi:MAG TPA: hypothetical protein VFF65_03220, partial [Phycisphaerales bacterium]|nr:hypothetical protein [Phycisphaerales bacterium]